MLKPIESWLSEVYYNITLKKPAKKSIHQTQSDKTLVWYHLLAYGIAATLGSGIYTVVGKVAKTQAGPAIMISILGSGLLSLLTAFCFLELATLVPANGSGYVYGYTFIGEFAGWSLGWISTLEYAFAASVSSVAITNNLLSLLKALNIYVPTWLDYASHVDDSTSIFSFNVIAFLLVMILMFVVLKGINYSARLNGFVTLANITLLVFIIGMGLSNIDPSNWSPFCPFPFTSLVGGAATMIYSYIGFDTICNLTSEAKSLRDIKIGVIGTVSIATIFYLLVGITLTGLVPLNEINREIPLVAVFESVNLGWVSHVVRLCATVMMLATLLTCLIGQPRIFQIMSKDGFMPLIFAKENNNGIATINIIFSCLLSGVVALLFNIYDLVDIISMGSILSFSMSAYGLLLGRLNLDRITSKFGTLSLRVFFIGSIIFGIVLRNVSSLFIIALVGIPGVLLPMMYLLLLFKRCKNSFTHNDEFVCTEQPSSSTSLIFESPLTPLIPMLSILGNSCVLATLELKTLYQFLSWMVVGTLVYIGYGYQNSRLRLEM